MDASIFLVLSRNNFLTSRVGPLNGEGVDAVDAHEAQLEAAVVLDAVPHAALEVLDERVERLQQWLDGLRVNDRAHVLNDLRNVHATRTR